MRHAMRAMAAPSVPAFRSRSLRAIAPKARRLEFFLPGAAVSVNRAYGRAGMGGHTYVTREAKAWRRYVRDTTFAEAVLANFAVGPDLLGATISYTLVGGRGDVDNVSKLLWDGVAEGLGVDDRIFKTGACSRERKPRGGVQGLRVLIEAIAIRGDEERRA